MKLNGFMSENFDIKQSVKQGDSLSCDIFVICVDPLIRLLSQDTILENPIKGTGNKKLDNTSCYADDTAPVVPATQQATYTNFLVINADKTEILSRHLHSTTISYEGKNFNISRVESTKICGKTFCFDPVIELNHNIIEKIGKLKTKLNIWLSRNLSLLGKVLIANTFGLSQLIHFMQCCEFGDEHLDEINQVVENFIWSNKRPKIKYLKLIAEYNQGGLWAPDAHSQYKAMNLNNF